MTMAKVINFTMNIYVVVGFTRFSIPVEIQYKYTMGVFCEIARSPVFIGVLVVPQSTISLNAVFDTFADWEDQLKPYRNELEELGL